MKRIIWMLFLLLTITVSSQLVYSHTKMSPACASENKEIEASSSQEAEALGTMILLPVSLNMNIERK